MQIRAGKEGDGATDIVQRRQSRKQLVPSLSPIPIVGGSPLNTGKLSNKMRSPAPSLTFQSVNHPNLSPVSLQFRIISIKRPTK